MAQAIAVFLSLYRYEEGEGAEVPYPSAGGPVGSMAWTMPHSDVSSDILARFHIFASLHPEKTSELFFNAVDGPADTWEDVWPQICAWFGLKAAQPDAQAFSSTKWIDEHKAKWSELAKVHGLRDGVMESTAGSVDFVELALGAPFRRDYDFSLSRSIGFTEERPHVDGYIKAFEQMRRFKSLPTLARVLLSSADSHDKPTHHIRSSFHLPASSHVG